MYIDGVDPCQPQKEDKLASINAACYNGLKVTRGSTFMDDNLAKGCLEYG